LPNAESASNAAFSTSATQWKLSTVPRFAETWEAPDYAFDSTRKGGPVPKLNIWWLSQYASTPDQQMTAQHDLAKGLVEKGHRVTIFAAGFSHYKFKEIRLAPGEKSRVEEHEGVRFVWLRTPPYNANNWKRTLNMCSYAWRSYWFGRGLSEKPDLIIGTTFQPLAALSAYALSVSKNSPFVFEVKDLWPLTMVQIGKLSPKSPTTIFLQVLEKFLARKAARIMTVLPGAADYYSQLGVPREKITWVPNGLDLTRYSSLKPYGGQLSKCWTLVYAGGHVQAFCLDMVLRAAQIQQQNGNRVRFVFIGGGQEKRNLEQLAQELKLQNIEFRGTVPKTELNQVLEQADAFILSMRDLPDLYRYGVSFNKLCDYAAAGRPVLFAGKPSNNVVEEYGFGIVIPPENPQAFSEAIQRFENLTSEQRAQMGRNGIRCAKERFDIAMLSDRLEKMLLSVAERSKTSSHPSGDFNPAVPPENCG
jgi:glycosyltransferase involved in cell wall biosynthesis